MKKYIYYGFGGFIGFVCGVGIILIFYAVEKSGHRILSDLVNDHGFIGKYIVFLVNNLHFIGIALGILMVNIMFKKELEDKDD